MVLHEAIARVLAEARPHGLPVATITRRVQEKGWYTRGDGRPVASQQVHARIGNYPLLFRVDKSSPPYKIHLNVSVAALLRPETLHTRKGLRAAGGWAPNQEWFWEGHIRKSIKRFFAFRGLTLKREADTYASGPDLLFSRWPILGDVWVETKGYPSKRYARGPKKGEAKPTRPEQQAKKWYAEALLSAILHRGEAPDDEVILGFPEMPVYEDLIRRTGWAIPMLRVNVYLVTQKGEVRPALDRRRAGKQKRAGN